MLYFWKKNYWKIYTYLAYDKIWKELFKIINVNWYNLLSIKMFTYMMDTFLYPFPSLKIHSILTLRK